MFFDQELTSDKIVTFINNILPRHQNAFLGCYPQNMIPWINLAQQSFCTLIANTDPAGEPGTHFICIIKTPDTITLWDSFGSDVHYEYFLSEAQQVCTQFNLNLFVNNVQFQSVISKACGPFCIWLVLALHFNFPNVNINQIQSKLDKHDYIHNEEIIFSEIEYYSERFFIKKCLFTMTQLIE